VQKLIMSAGTCKDIKLSVAAMTKPLPTQRPGTTQLPDEFHNGMVALMQSKPGCFQVTPEELATIQSSMSEDDIVTLFCERDGAHIIKTFMLYFEPEDRQFIYDAAEAKIMRLSTDRYGGATLQRCLEAGNLDQKIALAVAITRNAMSMVTDAHGNYILQHVLSMSLPSSYRGMDGEFLSHFLTLSFFLSHVCHMSLIFPLIFLLHISHSLAQVRTRQHWRHCADTSCR